MYFNNAALLSATLRRQGIGFSLLTNDASLLSTLVKSRISLAVEQIPTHVDVPTGLPFYSAHFKVDAYRHLAKQAHDYVLFSDLDAICINPVPPALSRSIESGTPLVYETTAQLRPSVGPEVLIRDVDIVAGVPSEGRWYGGEFVAGPPQFFEDLVSTIDALLPSYFSQTDVLANRNDETYLSAAIHQMRLRGVHIGDAGTIGAVGRYWSCRINHVQPDVEYYSDHFLVHLPADKKYLALLAQSAQVATAAEGLWAEYVRRIRERERSQGRGRILRTLRKALARARQAMGFA